MIEIKQLHKIVCEPLNCKLLFKVTFCDLYTDGTNRYIITAFYNKFSQNITSMKIRLYEYDKDKNLLTKEILTFENMCAPKDKYTTQHKPILVNIQCESIQYEILDIHYVTLGYSDGTFYDLNPKKIKKDNLEMEESVKEYKVTSNLKVKSSLLFGVAILLIILFILMLSFFAFRLCYPYVYEEPNYYALFDAINGGILK